VQTERTSNGKRVDNSAIGKDLKERPIENEKSEGLKIGKSRVKTEDKTAL